MRSKTRERPQSAKFGSEKWNNEKKGLKKSVEGLCFAMEHLSGAKSVRQGINYKFLDHSKNNYILHSCSTQYDNITRVENALFENVILRLQ